MPLRAEAVPSTWSHQHMKQALNGFIISAAIMIAMPVTARAEGYVAPWVGANWGSGNRIGNGRAAFGVSAGAMGGGIIGGEMAFGYSPSFFGTDNDFGHNTVIDLMGNLIVGVPVGGTHGVGIRPFVSGGIGLLRTQIDGGTLTAVSAKNNMLGWNAGAGVMGYFNDHVGVTLPLFELRHRQRLERGKRTSPGGLLRRGCVLRILPHVD